jgi:TonB family protein
MRANARVKQSSSGNAGAPPPARPVRVAAVIPADTRVTYAFRPDPADYYPAASMAAGEQGIALVRLCYDEIGKVVESTLAEGSGFPRLDEAAVRMGKQFRFKPAMAGGVPRPDCVVVPVRFSTQPDAASARYSGPNMSGSFTAIDVPTLLGIIAQSSGRRIVVDPSVTGTITLRATDVPWEQLLDIVVQTKGLEKRVTDNEIVIAAKERAAR